MSVPVLEDLPDPAGKAVLVRATLDLPLGADPRGPMAARRAEALGSTLRWLVGRGARVTVCGDAGEMDPRAEAGRFAQVSEVVRNLSPEVTLTDSGSGGGASAEDPQIIGSLVASHDMFVNDAFQWSYLPLPSLVLPPRSLPSAVGRSVQRNLESLAPLIDNPPRPFVAVLGGNRSFLRLHGLEGLVLRADEVLVGGMMALPLLQAIGRQPHQGASEEFLSECRGVYALTSRVLHQFHLPLDLVWSGNGGQGAVLPPGQPGPGEVMDVGPRTRVRFAEVIEGAGSVLWTGALGRVEDPRFSAGTLAAGAALKAATAPAVVGGDALVSVLESAGFMREGVSAVTATDSALELLKHGSLPALAAIGG